MHIVAITVYPEYLQVEAIIDCRESVHIVAITVYPEYLQVEAIIDCRESVHIVAITVYPEYLHVEANIDCRESVHIVAITVYPEYLHVEAIIDCRESVHIVAITVYPEYLHVEAIIDCRESVHIVAITVYPEYLHVEAIIDCRESVHIVAITVYPEQNGNFRHTIPNIKIDSIDVEQVDHAKLLGVTISHDFSWNKHVENIVKKAGKRLYMMYQLKRAGISQSDLVTVYLSVVRPVLEYACPVWHTNLQQYLSDNIETIQKRALRCIFGGASYAEILSNVGWQTLKDRRDCICKKNYFNGMKSQTHKLHHLLPDERHVNYEMRQSKLYPLPSFSHANEPAVQLNECQNWQ